MRVTLPAVLLTASVANAVAIPPTNGTYPHVPQPHVPHMPHNNGTHPSVPQPQKPHPPMPKPSPNYPQIPPMPQHQVSPPNGTHHSVPQPQVPRPQVSQPQVSQSENPYWKPSNTPYWVGHNTTKPNTADAAQPVKPRSAPVHLRERQMNPSANAQVVGDHSGTAGQAAGRIINAVLNKLLPLKDWTPARETFTKQTTALMWQNNPDRSRWVAVVCYNKGWHVKDRSAISDVVSMKLSLGSFHTDYDCMYIGHNNQFYTDSDGGYINLAYQYSSACSYDGATGDLTCR